MGFGFYLDVPSSKEGKVFACQTFTDNPRVQRYHLFMAAKKLRATVTNGQAVRCTTQGSPGQARHLKDDMQVREPVKNVLAEFVR